jgi:quercetin dioxygenase-like cupin family protein
MYALLACVLLGAALPTRQPLAADAAAAPAGETKTGVMLENLLQSQLAGFEGAEVIVSRVTVPPHTALPKHWHPGEEFAYILEGSVVLWQDGKDDVLARTGEVVAVPLKQVHTAVTKDEGATILVFRVHEQGKPERIPVE